MAVGQNQWYHFGVVYLNGDWDVYWGYGILNHSHMGEPRYIPTNAARRALPFPCLFSANGLDAKGLAGCHEMWPLGLPWVCQLFRGAPTWWFPVNPNRGHDKQQAPCCFLLGVSHLSGDAFEGSTPLLIRRVSSLAQRAWT